MVYKPEVLILLILVEWSDDGEPITAIHAGSANLGTP